MPIYFEKEEKIAEILDPNHNFQLNKQVIEHRKDPLTSSQSIILKGRLNYVKHFFETDENYLFQYAEETKKSCPFCPLSIESSTPRFPPEIVHKGMIKRGEAVMFPSLFAHIEYNAVTALTKNHLLKLDEFKPEVFTNGISASLDYIRKVHAKDENVRYAALIFNYLPPAGSTVVHPHMQTIASSIPFQRVKEVIDSSRLYFEKWRSNYWTDIIEVEKKKKQRYLGNIGSSEWFVPFSPRGFYEVNSIVHERINFLDLTEDDVSNISEGLHRILLFYKENNIWSFNIAIFSGPLGIRLKHFAVNLTIIARYGFRQKWVNDMWALPYLLNETEVFDSPENLTSALKKSF